MIGAKVTAEWGSASAKVRAFAGKIPATLGRGVEAYMWRLARHAAKTRFSGPGTPTDSLKVDTGLARRTVLQSPRIRVTPSTVRGVMGAKPAYVRKHELGGRYTEYVPAHWRKRTTQQKRAARKRLRVQGPSAAGNIRLDRIFVSAHTRTVNYRARHMIRHAITETVKGLKPQLVRVLRELFRTGKIPTVVAGKG